MPVGGDFGTVALEIGDGSVSVLAESSFGSFGYHWSRTGADPVAFLRRISFDYAMMKFRGRDYEVYDRSGQERELKSQVLAARRSKGLSAEEAREQSDDVVSVCEASTVNEFKSNMYHSSLLAALYDNDCSAVDAKLVYDPQCVGFWDAIWVPLMAHLGKVPQAALAA